jgi:subtilisin-like proprotein convertase family protein
MRFSLRRLLASLFARSERWPPRRVLDMETLEDRLTPAGFFLTGVGSNTLPAQPFARLFDTANPGFSSAVVGPGDINAFPGFNGSVRVAAGDVNHDGVDDIICAEGPGGGSRVRIFDGKSALFSKVAVPIADFFAYSNVAGPGTVPGFGGGVFVASVDLNGDGFDELITSPGAGARGHVKVFDFNNGSGGFLGSVPILRTSFFAYTDFAGEVRVSTLERTIGGVVTPFVVTASGKGTTQCDVRLYANAISIGQVPDLTFVPPAVQFFPFPGYAGGVSVAAGDTDGDGNDELFVSKNDGISVVRVFNIAAVMASGSSTPAPAVEFQAFVGFLGEVRLGAADVDGDGKVEVLTSTGSSPGAQGSHIKAWSIAGGTASELRSFFAYQGYIGGVFLSTNDFTWTQEFPSTDTPQAIPDNTPTGILSAIVTNLQVLNPSTLTHAKRIEIDLNISHTFNADLDVSLTHGATTLSLFTDVNGGGDGFQVTLSDFAPTAIEAAPVPPAGTPLTGTFRPETPASLLAAFNGMPISGSWILNVVDDSAGGTGTLNSWRLRLVF